MARVLVADDEPSIVYLYEEFYKSKGFEVDSVDNGADAMKKFKNNEYHLLVLDIKMGEEHGLKVLENIIREGHAIPIIICSAYKHMKQDVDLIAGEDKNVEFINKPIDLNELWDKTVELLENYAIQTED